MKYSLTILLLLSALGAGMWRAPVGANVPSGRYLDLRTATVFGGACHIGSERQSQGRNGLLAWSLESGSHAGQDLAGVKLVAAVSASANLADEGARRSRLVIDAPTEAAAQAARNWVLEVAADALDQVEEVQLGALLLKLDGERFKLDVPDFAQAEGHCLPDRACCSMPDQRWYEPLVGQDQVAQSLVGFGDAVRFQGQGSLPAWRYNGANNALFGSFGSLGESERVALAQAQDS